MRVRENVPLKRAIVSGRPSRLVWRISALFGPAVGRIGLLAATNASRRSEKEL